MRLIVIIPTLGRGTQVTQLLDHLAGQTRLPDEVVISAPDESHFALPGSLAFPVVAAYGPRGSSAQRNTALELALGRFDVITFLDDDFVPAANYFEQVQRVFVENSDFAVVMGHVVRDGACTKGISWDDALACLATDQPPAEPVPVDHVGAYGCNMSVRASGIGSVRFDERLVLYGWQEDIDFSSRLRNRGRVVCLPSIRGVHLGVKSGRVSGTRFGYSQIANPIYLIRKGSVPASFALPLMARNLAANLARSCWPETYVDRRGRLKGNLIALWHLLTGRVEPEYILKL